MEEKGGNFGKRKERVECARMRMLGAPPKVRQDEEKEKEKEKEATGKKKEGKRETKIVPPYSNSLVTF